MSVLRCDPLRNILLVFPMQIQCFLTGSPTLSSVSAACQSTAEPKREPVKLYLIGSLQGIASITHTLHHRGFAEVNDWGQPQPTGNAGEYVSVLIRQVLLS